MDGEGVLKIQKALDQSANREKGEPAGYFRSLETEIDQFEQDITASKQKIIDQINEIATEKAEFEQRKEINADFIA